jgi:hypothetical protein
MYALSRLFLLLFLLALVAASPPAAAQIQYTGGTFSQSFNSLIASGSAPWKDNGTVPGWFTYRTAAGAPAAVLDAGDGSLSTTGIVYSYGAASASTRALGILPGLTPGSVMWGACFENETGKTLTSFNLTYDGEQWRAASKSPQSLQVAFQVGPVANLDDGTWTPVQPANFNAPVQSLAGALDGAAPANSSPGISYSVGRINWPPGTELWIRWENPVQPGGNAALAINNVHFSASDTASVDPYALMREEAIQSITDMEAMLGASAAPNPETRDLTMCAYEALALNIPNAVPIAENLLEEAFDHQFPDGSFPQNLQDGSVDSGNWTQFTMLPIGPIFLRYGPLLDHSFVSEAMPHIKAGLQAVINQSLEPNYTNMYTMQLVNMMLLGQVTGNSAAQKQGLDNLNAWISNEQTVGLSEYDSPTYSMIDYNSLIIGENNTTNSTAEARLLAMLNYMSADLCANFVDGFSGNLGGAHSRDYTFPIGDDEIEHFYYYAGVRQALPDLYDYNAGLPVVMNEIEGGYSPDSSITAAAASPTRIVQEIWGAHPGQDRYTYISPDYTIGSTSALFGGGQDKQIAATFPTPEIENQITVVYDSFDSPYGTVTVDGKPVHLDNAPVTVQDGPTILSLSNLGPQFTANPAETYTSLATDIVFPGNADELYLNGKPITSHSTISTSLGSVLGVRVGDALVAVRAGRIDSYAGYESKAYIKFDGPNNAARFVYYHYKGPAIHVPSATIRSALFLSATTVTTEAAATEFLTNVANTTFKPILDGSTWSASVNFAGATLAVSENTAPNITYPVIYRKVNGKNYTSPRFLVTSGGTATDYAATLLAPIPTQ